MSEAGSSFSRKADNEDLLAPTVLPANVQGVGLQSSLRSAFQSAVQNTAAPVPEAAQTQDLSARPLPRGNEEIAARAEIASSALTDKSQKMKVPQSDMSYGGASILGLGKELFGLGKASADNDDFLFKRQPVPVAMAGGPTGGLL